MSVSFTCNQRLRDPFYYCLSRILPNRHDRGTEAACSDTGETNYGWRDPDGHFYTVMAYRCKPNECDNSQSYGSGGCPRIEYISGDDFYDVGGTVGLRSLGGTASSCRAQIMATMQSVSEFRVSESEVPSMMPSVSPSMSNAPSKSISPSGNPTSSSMPSESSAPSFMPSSRPSLRRICYSTASHS